MCSFLRPSLRHFSPPPLCFNPNVCEYEVSVRGATPLYCQRGVFGFALKPFVRLFDDGPTSKLRRGPGKGSLVSFFLS